MISTITFIFLCISNETRSEAFNTNNNLYRLDFNNLLNNGTFDKLLNSKKTELEEQLCIKEICNKKVNNFIEKMISIFSLKNSKTFDIIRDENTTNFIFISIFFEEELMPRIKNFNKIIEIYFKEILSIQFEEFVNNKNFLNGQFYLKHLNLQEAFNKKITYEKKIDVINADTRDLIVEFECINNKKSYYKDFNDLKMENNLDFINEKLRYSYNKKLFDYLISLQLNLNKWLVIMREDYIKKIYELKNYFFKEIKNYIFVNNKEGFEKVCNLFDNKISSVCYFIDFEIEKESKKMIYEYLLK